MSTATANRPTTLAGWKSIAYRNFVAETRDEAIAQYVATALERREYARRGSMNPGGSKINRDLAIRAIRKANRIRKAADWRSTYLDDSF